MGAVTLDAIAVTTLGRIATPGGDVLHAMKRSDAGYVGFGEAYFSWVHGGAIKAWKQHQRMTLNLVVPVGLVRFVFTLHPRSGEFRDVELGEAAYARLTVPPGVWFGFTGLAAQSLVLNVADISHDPDEVQRLPVDAIPYAWSRA